MSVTCTKPFTLNTGGCPETFGTFTANANQTSIFGNGAFWSVIQTFNMVAGEARFYRVQLTASSSSAYVTAASRSISAYGTGLQLAGSFLEADSGRFTCPNATTDASYAFWIFATQSGPVTFEVVAQNQNDLVTTEWTDLVWNPFAITTSSPLAHDGSGNYSTSIAVNMIARQCYALLSGSLASPIVLGVYDSNFVLVTPPNRIAFGAEHNFPNFSQNAFFVPLTSGVYNIEIYFPGKATGTGWIANCCDVFNTMNVTPVAGGTPLPLTPNVALTIYGFPSYYEYRLGNTGPTKVPVSLNLALIASGNTPLTFPQITDAMAHVCPEIAAGTPGLPADVGPLRTLVITATIWRGGFENVTTATLGQVTMHETPIAITSNVVSSMWGGYITFTGTWCGPISINPDLVSWQDSAIQVSTAPISIPSGNTAQTVTNLNLAVGSHSITANWSGTRSNAIAVSVTSGNIQVDASTVAFFNIHQDPSHQFTGLLVQTGAGTWTENPTVGSNMTIQIPQFGAPVNIFFGITASDGTTGLYFRNPQGISDPRGNYSASSGSPPAPSSCTIS